MRIPLPNEESNKKSIEGSGAKGSSQAVFLPLIEKHEETDEMLVKRAVEGQTAAFDQLVVRYQDRVFNILLRMSGSPVDAEDLAQETFFKAYKALGSFRQGSRFYTWLFRIAANTSFSKRRQEVGRRKHEGGSLDATGGNGDHGESSLAAMIPGSSDSDPARQLDKKLLRESVLNGLRELDEDYKAVLILREIEGMDYDSIADTLSLSRAAVKSRLHRARLEMARILRHLKE